MTDEIEDTIDDVTADAIINIAEGVPSYDRYIDCSISALLFQGETIEQWIENIKLPEMPDNVSVIELEDFNNKYMVITETIMKNYSIAKTGFNYSIIHYKKALNSAKNDLISSYNRQNKKIPGKELLEDLAKNNIMDVYTACKIAGMFLDFWEIQFEKIKLASYRLSAMNSLKSQEYRVS